MDKIGEQIDNFYSRVMQKIINNYFHTLLKHVPMFPSRYHILVRPFKVNILIIRLKGRGAKTEDARTRKICEADVKNFTNKKYSYNGLSYKLALILLGINKLILN